MAKCNCKSGIEALEPAAVWGFFFQMAAIPHASKHEDRICKWARGVAEAHGLAVREDSVGNVIIEVPASKGCESAPITVLQGHLDMVCEKNADSAHNFDRDPLRLVVDCEKSSGLEIVRAEGTTLGADNGIGLAMGLAAATDPDVKHGPLELLFTIDEETGMTGANALTSETFKGRRLLNLDSEEDDALYIGCAGGCDAELTFDLASTPLDRNAAWGRVVVSGLRGGHSGGDIHENRGNAIKVLTRVLLRTESDSLRIATIRGGQLRNAIPREAEVVVAGSEGTLEALRVAAAAVTEEAIGESAEQKVSIVVQCVAADDVAVGDVAVALSAEDSRRIVAALAALPHGVLGMHPKIAGLVETSNNVATVTSKVADGQSGMRVSIGCLSRSSSASRLHEALSQISAVGELAGAAVRISGEYPGWSPDMDSRVLASCRRVYAESFGEEPKVTAIHAGLECGIIGERVGGVDMASFGPRIEGAHSPDERVYVASVQKSWKYLKAVLAELARG